MTAVAIFIGGTAVALWVWTGLGRAASAGDRMAGRTEHPTGRHQLAHLGRQRSIDQLVRPAPHWRNP